MEWGGVEGWGIILQTAVRYFLTESEIFVPLFFYNLFLFSLKDNTQTHTRYSVQPMNRGGGLK